MSERIEIAVITALVVPVTVLGTWLARNHPHKSGRIFVALATVAFASFGSLDVGYRLSSLRGVLTTTLGYSCGEAKILDTLLIFGAIVLIRAAWLSIHADGSRAGRASKLALICLGLFLIGVILSESERAHDRFHQVHYPRIKL